MPDVFISYSVNDEVKAREIYNSLRAVSVDVFMAGISLEPGVIWKEEILENLRNSNLLLFIATKSSIASDAVKHELGGALINKKEIISICIDVLPTELPRWIQDRQAIALNSESAGNLQVVLEKVAKRVKIKNLINGVLLIGFIVLAVWALFSKDNKQ